MIWETRPSCRGIYCSGCRERRRSIRQSMKIEFDESRTQKPDKLMRVVYVEPNREPFEVEIFPDLEHLQKAADGYIEAVYLDDGAIVVANEESKLRAASGGMAQFIKTEGKTASEYCGLLCVHRAWKRRTGGSDSSPCRRCPVLQIVFLPQRRQSDRRGRRCRKRKH